MEQQELFNKACNTIASFDNKFVYRNKNYTTVFKDKTSEHLWKLSEYIVIIIIFFSVVFLRKLEALFSFIDSSVLRFIISILIILLLIIIVHNLIGRTIRKSLFKQNKV
ncbi:MAG: hypothetical protein ACI4WM_01140, partial [Erysipelotrichaceae bacterium]